MTSDVLYSDDTWVRPGSTGDPKKPLELDIYRSSATAAGARLPLVMVIHSGAKNAFLEPCIYSKTLSLPRQARDKRTKIEEKGVSCTGGFMQGSKTEATIASEATFLAQHGFVVASINYRLTAAKGLPDVGSVRNAVIDAQNSIAFMLEQPGVDASRVAIFGTSAGAIIGGTIGQVPRSLSSRGGVSDRFVNISAAVGVSGCLWPFLIDGEAPLPAPWLDIHGTQDSRVFPFLAELTHNYLNALGVPEERNLFATVPGGGHVDVRMEGQVDTWGAAVKAVMRPEYVSFFVHHMRLSGATCGD